MSDTSAFVRFLKVVVGVPLPDGQETFGPGDEAWVGGEVARYMERKRMVTILKEVS